jgi:hypothetical protein
MPITKMRIAGKNPSRGTGGRGVMLLVIVDVTGLRKI